MTADEVRAKFLEFMKAHGHAITPSASLVPENDPTTLFTGSGMQPMIPYLLGARHPLGRRLADSQKCFRAEDIDEVGDNRHTTFFEMLGNWSLGDPAAPDKIGTGYWKEEQLQWLFEFLTEEIALPAERLYVTVFAGDEENGIPKDEQSIEVWRNIFGRAGISNGLAELGTVAEGHRQGIKKGERIFAYDVTKNWWSRSGPPDGMPSGEPGGPDSEIFYEFTEIEHDKKYGEYCHPNCDCGRFLEIGNSVFMEYRKKEGGSFEKLIQRNVDFGGGLERITAAANDNEDVFDIDVFRSLTDVLPAVMTIKAKRIVADHIRGAVFLISDGVIPSNKERGYVLRRLLRRAITYTHHARKGSFSETDVLGMGSEIDLTNVISKIVDSYKETYPDLEKNKAQITSIFLEENSRFTKTLSQGLREIKKIDRLDGKTAFDLLQTFGFPLELTIELAKESGQEINLEDFKKEFENHQKLSRTASAGTFKGGLADTSAKTTQLHTAHHLLLKALQIVLGPQAKQRGSNITQERLRLDFTHGEKMTEAQKREVERMVNETIAADLPVIKSEMPKEEAEKLGAEHEFGQKYPERVSVYSVGPRTATPANPQFEQAFSIEFCGGPHVGRTGEIRGKFRIAKEEAVSAGIRRIRGIIE